MQGRWILWALWFVMPLSVLSWTQEKRMDELNQFIEYYSKYIVSVIWQRYVLTPHLSHANCCKPCNASDSCCQFAPTCYVIHLVESYQDSSKVKPFRMLNNGTLILLYFALRTVSLYRFYHKFKLDKFFIGHDVMSSQVGLPWHCMWLSVRG